MSDEFDNWLHSKRSEIEPCAIAPGTIVGGYRIIGIIGRGGSSEVYSAEGIARQELVAIKFLINESPSAKKRFLREARLLGDEKLVGFPSFISQGEFNGHPYLIEELLVDGELPKTDDAVADYLIKVSASVKRLHLLGLVHRDIKPNNILWRNDGTPVLTDLGLVYDTSAKSVNPALSVVDGVPMVVGTPGYSAPEQFTGGKIDASADIHALGVLANTCFDNKPPRCWERIIRRAANTIPARRYGTVDEFVHAIKARHRLRNSFWIILAVAAFAAISLLTISTAADMRWERRMTAAGRIFPADRSFSILPIDKSELLRLSEIGVDGWGMGEIGDSPIVLVQKLVYSGDFQDQAEFQRNIAEVYGGRTLACEEVVPGKELMVEIENWHEGELRLYIYRKLFLGGDVIYQVSGQTQMMFKDRDCEKLKACVDSFEFRENFWGGVR